MTQSVAAAPCGFDRFNSDHEVAMEKALRGIRFELEELKEATGCSDRFIAEMLEACITDHLRSQG